jgi:HD-GYP domain-containing protein (c-di-GMP phosphodiesterase class II)
LQAVGFAASYTLPMLHDGELFGFFFCDSRQRAYFTASVAGQLDPLLRLVALTVVCELRAIRTLAAATATARHITSHRDFETGAHLERMANYSRLIARDLADEVNLSDEYIEHLFLFAPLHDIGKIAIPDSILLKTGPLTHDEFAQMQTHPAKGLQMVDFMLQEFSLTTLAHAGVLRHVVFMHHEAFDGSGYPQGLRGEAIPLEARIVAAADMFDALTSLRPYKPAWPIEIALAELSRFAGKKLDPRCVQALHAHRGEIEAVRERFQETVYG